MNNVIVIGAVNSTAETIHSLVRNGIMPKGILGYAPAEIEDVSGWTNLKEVAEKYEIPFKSFLKINDEENIEWARLKKPEIIFAVGFSQLLNKSWLDMPTLGCIGFHPTKLPKGRGRAPIAWLILNEKKGASSFFLMGEGADDGPVFVQKEFIIESTDNASIIEGKILAALSKALDEWLPKLKNGEWKPIPQNEKQASWFGKRSPVDGIIDWNDSAKNIDKLIKASSYPYPGSFTFHNHEKLIIWESTQEKEIDIKGVTGRILIINDSKGLLIQCGEGLIWIKNLSKKISQFRVGQKLGYNTQVEINKIWTEINKLKNG